MDLDTTPRSTTPPTTTDRRVARLFGLDGEAWMRHANPLSVWTRFTCPSLIALAVWSRTWIGWYSLIPIAAMTLWLVLNPLLFGVPRSTANWASRSVLGERIWVDRTKVALPDAFVSQAPNVASVYSCVGAAALTYGLVVLDIWSVIAGIVIIHGGKLWYLDRMVLLFAEMKQRHPTYAASEYTR